ncbi:MAG: hypothetical protein KA419_12810 [Acidobacteria bacterium]|nr:hypothetical protein [Acidobacteriota bacterium]
MTSRHDAFQRKGFLLTGLFLLVLAAPLFAGVDRWSNLGPNDGIRNLVASPAPGGAAFALFTNVGLMKSLDGLTWAPINTDTLMRTCTRLYADPLDADTLFAADDPAATLYRSTDGGLSWAPVLTLTPVSGYAFGTLQTAPSVPTIRYISYTGSIFRSEDSGEHWTILAFNSDSRFSTCLAVFPDNPNHFLTYRQVYSTFPTGAYLSRYSVSENQFTDLLNLSCMGCTEYPVCAVLDPDDPLRIFLLTYISSPGGQYGRFYSTTNGGINWSERVTLPTTMNALLLDRYQPNTLYAGGNSAAVSRDGGATWTTAHSSAGKDLSRLPGQTDRLLAIMPCGSKVATITTSQDGMVSWREAESGLSNADVLASVSCWETPWGGASIPLMPDAFWEIFTPQNWRDTALASRHSALALVTNADPYHLLDFYSVEENGNVFFWGSPGRSLGTNGVPAVPRLSLAAIRGAGGKDELYLGTAEGLYKGIPGSGSACAWTKLFPAGAGAFNVNCISVSPNDPSSLYLGSDDGVYRGSTGSADSWQKICDLPTGPVRQVTEHPANPFLLFAAAANGFYRSTSGGYLWVDTSDGLTCRDVRALVPHPLNPSTVYAATAGGGVFMSTDRGAHWSSMGTMHNPDVRSLGFVMQPFTLLAGTPGDGLFGFTPGGVWDLDRNGVTDASDQALVGSMLAEDLTLNQFDREYEPLYPKYTGVKPSARMDLNGDGKVDILDYYLMTQAAE